MAGAAARSSRASPSRGCCGASRSASRAEPRARAVREHRHVARRERPAGAAGATPRRGRWRRSPTLPTRGGMPLAMGLLFVSLFIIVSRKKAITQVIGFLMLENAIALLAVLGTYGVPLIVELGVFLDALMGFLVMQIFLYDIHDTFEHDRRRAAQAAEALSMEPCCSFVGLLAPWAAPRPRWLAAVRRVTAGPGRAGRRSPRRDLARCRRRGCGGSVLAGAAAVAGPGDLLRVDAPVGAARGVHRGGRGAGDARWPGLETGRRGRRPGPRRFRIFGNLFALSMLVAVTINNVGLMWVAIEATTITSAILIPLHRHQGVGRSVVEVHPASGRSGIALAFAGTVLAYFDFVQPAGRAGRRPELDGAHGRRRRRCTRTSCDSRSSSCWSATARRPASRRCTRGCPTRTRRRRRRCRP